MPLSRHGSTFTGIGTTHSFLAPSTTIVYLNRNSIILLTNLQIQLELQIEENVFN